MSIQIIQADTTHAEAIARIGAAAFTHSFRCLFYSKKELSEYLRYTYNAEKIRASLHKSRNVYFVALLNDEPIGFAKVKRDSLHESLVTGSQMELQKIYVLPEYQGLGAGRTLMKTVRQFASLVQPDYLWLDAHVANSRALRFYEKAGFVKGGKHFFRIGAQVFAYFMMCLPVKQKETCLS